MSGLYNDLDDIENRLEIVKLKEDIQKCENENVGLKVTVRELTDQVQVLLTDRNQLESNMVALYNTAIREVQRKDREIADLQSRLNMQQRPR